MKLHQWRIYVTEEDHSRTNTTYWGSFLREFSIQPVGKALDERVSSGHYDTAIETLRYKTKIHEFQCCQ